MRRLLLIRHAKAADPAGVADADRPLAERGVAQALALARRLARQGPRPETLLVSPARRTRDTALAIAEILGLPPQRLLIEAQAYLASDHTLLGLLHDLDDAWTCAALIGHNPGLRDLVCHLSGRELEHLPTAACAVLEAPLASWSDLAEGTCRLLRCDETEG